MRKNRVFGIAAMVAILLLTGTVAYMASEGISVRLLEASLREEKLKAETMLSEKLQLEKEIVKQEAALSTLRETNGALQYNVDRMAREVNDRDARIRAMRREYAGATRLKQQHEALQTEHEAQAVDLADARRSQKGMLRVQEDLEQTIALLLQQNKNLTGELHAWRLSAVKDVRVEPYRKNERLTLRARKTRKLVVHVDVASRVEDLQFRITDPAGRVLSAEAGKISTTVVNDGIPPKYVASTRQTVLKEYPYKRVAMVFTPSERLEAGIYQIDILNDTESIGSLQVKFR
ncbi:hypothetical protein KK062_19560 [Fulvivirgaceae bacterium PWU5]|uniref:Uncharacterized protein n=1 Tax=Dawidia cretensis TaxID=2782350 RepID=A0AAP2DZV5_9BACT|nr:hypothetical protein [Dawidia cretensis]MBT1710451.1 hypothetical protein [Dawidia cretensis]